MRRILIPFFVDSLAKGFPFILFFILAHLLPPEDIALIGLFDSARNLFIIPIVFNLVNFNASSYFRDDNIVFQNNFVQSLAFSTFVAIAILLLLIAFSETASNYFSLPFYIILAALFISLFEAFQRNRVIHLQVEKRFRSFSLVALSFSVFTFCLTLVDLALINKTWEVRPRGLAVSGILFFCYHIWSIKKEFPVPFFPKWLKMKEFFLFGIFLIPHNLLNWTFKSADKILVLSFMEQKQLGYYSLMSQLSLVTFLVGSSLNYALKTDFFKILKVSEPNKIAQLIRLTLIFSGTLLTFSFFNAFVGEQVTYLFLPKGYHPSTPLLYYLCPAMALMIILSFLFNYFYYTVKTAWIGAGSILFSILHIGLMAHFLKKSDILGAGQAMLTSSLVMVLFTVFTLLMMGKLKKL